jgi:hypothetical protein
MKPADSDAKKIFKPDDMREVLLGWLLHAHKGRDRHDWAARRCERIRLWVGAPAAVFSAIVGTSVFAALGKEASSTAFKAVIAAISIASAILTGLATFLNMSERAEKHRSAGVRYKEMIWELERIVGGGANGATPLDPSLVERFQKRMNELEESAPVVPKRIYDRVEDEWKRVEFIPKANELYQPKMKT